MGKINSISASPNTITYHFFCLTPFNRRKNNNKNKSLVLIWSLFHHNVPSETPLSFYINIIEQESVEERGKSSSAASDTYSLSVSSLGQATGTDPA